MQLHVHLFVGLIALVRELRREVRATHVDGDRVGNRLQSAIEQFERATRIGRVSDANKCSARAGRMVTFAYRTFTSVGSSFMIETPSMYTPSCSVCSARRTLSTSGLHKKPLVLFDRSHCEAMCT